MLEDRLLVWRSQRGSKEAMRRIYEKYKDDLLTSATALLTDRAAAEDAVHDVFVSFARGLGAFSLTGSLKGYLATCVGNKARDVLRSSTRKTSVLEEHASLPASERSPDQQALQRDELRKVHRALGRLPYEQREVVVLHLQNGLTFKRIAQLQEVSVNTAQGRYRYGMEKLRSLMNGEMIQ
jgi:RNA polymerase sigma-70 factor, ECF subfamily